MRIGKALLVGLSLVAIAAPSQASTITYGFDEITANSAINVETQLFVQVTDETVGLLPGQVDFIFTNTGLLASSITDIYFDDGSLLSIASITNGGGTNFSEGASPGTLPGGNSIGFSNVAPEAYFTSDSNPPTEPNGVNPGETLTIRFNLIDLQDWDDVVAALNLGLANPGEDVVGGLRIGLHVQGLSDGKSESYVNGPPTSVPDGGTTLSLLGGALLGLGLLRRKFNV